MRIPLPGPLCPSDISPVNGGNPRLLQRFRRGEGTIQHQRCSDVFGEDFEVGAGEAVAFQECGVAFVFVE